MKIKNLIFIILAIIGIWSFYAYQIRKITKLENEIIKIKKEINELEKEKKERIYEFDEKMDLKKIEAEMKEKHGMEISEKINFFKLEKSSH